MNYKSIAEKAIVNMHSSEKTAAKGKKAVQGGSALLNWLQGAMGSKQTANDMTSYAQNNMARLAPGALAGAGIGGIGGFATADGGRNKIGRASCRERV